MKTIALLFFAFLFVSCANAGRATFAEIPWGSDRQGVEKILEERGFSTTPLDEELDLLFTGKLLGHAVTGWASFTPDYQVAVILISFQADLTEAFDVFDRVEKHLEEKYGTPEKQFKFFDPPYRTTDSPTKRILAIAADCGMWATFWPQAGLYVKVAGNPINPVVIHYEGPLWSQESDRRKAIGAENF
ncbi:MAG: hypothetical protein FJ088_06855 [Deltaproteobacteria bacterium]|nr:hypothetical protein [Deltaproteobacteria bacterium]